MCAGSSDFVAAVFVPIDKDVAEVIVQAELEQGIAGTCCKMPWGWIKPMRWPIISDTPVGSLFAHWLKNTRLKQQNKHNEIPRENLGINDFIGQIFRFRRGLVFTAISTMLES